MSVKVSFHHVCEEFSDYVRANGVGFRDRCAGKYYILFSRCFWKRFLGYFCSWSRDIGENALTADYDHLHREMFRFTVHNYRSIAIDMLENSDLMEKINFRKWSALMCVKFCFFMTKTKQTLLNR